MMKSAIPCLLLSSHSPLTRLLTKQQTLSTASLAFTYYGTLAGAMIYGQFSKVGSPLGGPFYEGAVLLVGT